MSTYTIEVIFKDRDITPLIITKIVNIDFTTGFVFFFVEKKGAEKGYMKHGINQDTIACIERID